MMNQTSMRTSISLCVLALCLSMGWAEEEAAPTAVSAEVEIEEAETATKVPAAVAEAQRFASELGAFDLKTWRTAAENRSEKENCLKKVDEHLAEGRESMRTLFSGTTSVRCRVDGSGHVSLWMKNETIGKAFDESYREHSSGIEEIRTSLADGGPQGDLSQAVEAKVLAFRQEICKEIVQARKKINPKVEYKGRQKANDPDS